MKMWRRLLAGVLACLLCMSLAGCHALDEAKANHGLLQPDGSVRLGDVVYKPLPACEQLSPELEYTADVSVTASDVPVLLASMMGSSYYKSKDGVLLIWQYDGLEEDNGINYCREDRYEKMVARIEAGFKPDGYCYEYERYDEEAGEFWSEFYYLTDFNFPGFLVGRRSLVQEGGTQISGNDQYTGLRVQADLKAGTQTAWYVNSNGEILSGTYPFAQGEFQKITFERKRP